MNTIEYFFYEWLIIEKGITTEQFEQFSQQAIKDLKTEFINYTNKTITNL